MMNGRINESKCGPVNQATRATVSALGVIFGLSGVGHGFFEALQGNTRTDGLVIHAIGEANRMWAYGNEPAFTVIPNFLITGIIAMIVSLAIIIWSAGFMHRKKGLVVYLVLFALSLLVGAGIGQVFLFLPAWAFSTRIHKPLAWWRKVLPIGLRRVLARSWSALLVLSSALILYALIIAIFGIVPGVSNPDVVTLVMLTSLGAGILMMIFAFISGFAHDIEQEAVSSGKTHAGGIRI